MYYTVADELTKSGHAHEPSLSWTTNENYYIHIEKYGIHFSQPNDHLYFVFNMNLENFKFILLDS